MAGAPQSPMGPDSPQEAPVEVSFSKACSETTCECPQLGVSCLSVVGKLAHLLKPASSPAADSRNICSEPAQLLEDRWSGWDRRGLAAQLPLVLQHHAQYQGKQRYPKCPGDTRLGLHSRRWVSCSLVWHKHGVPCCSFIAPESPCDSRLGDKWCCAGAAEAGRACTREVASCRACIEGHRGCASGSVDLAQGVPLLASVLP